MELQYFGANCVRVNTKKASIVIDDNLSQLGLKTITKPEDISLATNSRIPKYPSAFATDMPGEYEISEIIIHGIAARSQLDEEGQKNAVIYTVSTPETKIAVIGHIYPELNENQLEEIGMVDLAIVPIGGNGYTLDGAGALKVVKQIEPKVIVPTHFADKGVKYEVPQQGLSEALKELGMEPADTVPKLKIAPAELTEATRLIIIERQ